MIKSLWGSSGCTGYCAVAKVVGVKLLSVFANTRVNLPMQSALMQLQACNLQGQHFCSRKSPICGRDRDSVREITSFGTTEGKGTGVGERNYVI